MHECYNFLLLQVPSFSYEGYIIRGIRDKSMVFPDLLDAVRFGKDVPVHDWQKHMEIHQSYL